MEEEPSLYSTSHIPHHNLPDIDSTLPSSLASLAPTAPSSVHNISPTLPSSHTQFWRSSKPTRPPIWTIDFMCPTLPNSNQISLLKYPINNYLTYANLSPTYQTCLSSISALSKPTSFTQASKDPNWIAAMQQELQALKRNGTWSFVPLPSGKTPIGCKWVYKLKYHADGTLERYKAKLVAKSFTRQAGIDYEETFSLVVKMVTIRLILAIASLKN
ncbi:uncharacterized protein LOC116142745 [Pistacia vera]|uniref:uncharacterized protein LOC116142745 n=1 Tax=Pistacia vera TaxID=55513 RepID=UPI0012630BE9|nr:uncharacterized protein LOC116142745 [Pistacia vera]